MMSEVTCHLRPRRCQQEILDLIFGARQGEDKWYIVAPPGSGKTILGLMVAVRLGVPAVVLAPTTAIQGQWIDKTRFFSLPPGMAGPMASADPEAGAPITVLTYQALAQTTDLPADERQAILAAWREELITDQEDTPAEADDWLANYEAQNPERFQASLLRRWKRRRMQTAGDAALSLVEEGAVRTMERLRMAGVGLVILDECHHLIGYWAQVALALVGMLGAPRVLGLTATPPDPEDLQDQEIALHRELLHEVDYELPTPAVVRDGGLAPYQDLAWFTRPTAAEIDYVRTCATALTRVMTQVESHPGTTLSAWLQAELALIPDDKLASTLRRRAVFMAATVRYLRERQIALPPRLASVAEGTASIEEKAELVGRYATRALLISRDERDRELFEELRLAFRPLGYLLTEAGLRRCQSSVNRVLALSAAKTAAAVAILETELRQPGVDVRALVICDFERSSATADKAVAHLLTDESGGAIAAMRALTSHPATDRLDPILVTGQTVIVDDDLLPRFEREATAWFAERGLRATFVAERDGGFFRLTGSGPDWATRHYVAMVTALFERGTTRCLVGTRGLLGEGWDSLTANTLIDLTTAATRMTVNQLRGRAIRLNPENPTKVANIWDVVCLAPEFVQGLSDYHRFARKHSAYFGLCDDGEIEYGLGHIHPGLTEAGPEQVALNAHLINAEMTIRSGDRQKVRAAWRIGQPYVNRTQPAVEIQAEGLIGERAVRGTVNDMEGYRITAASALKNLCLAVMHGLREIGALQDTSAKVRVSERADRYFRLFLDTHSEVDMTLVARSINELFQPLAGQRYIIPRYEQVLEATWLSRLLPAIFRDYVSRRRNRIAVYHPLPEIFGESKEKAAVFSDQWNQFVSPGRAIYTKRGEGEEILAEAKPQSNSVLQARAKLKQVWR